MLEIMLNKQIQVLVFVYELIVRSQVPKNRDVFTTSLLIMK